MAAGSEERISSYIDLQAVGKETDSFQKQLMDIYNLYRKINSTKITLEGSKSFSEVTSAVRKLKTEEDELNKIQGQIESSYKKRMALESQQAKILAEEKELLRQRNAELKNTVREENAAAGSIEELRAKLIRLQKEYDNLGRAERVAIGGQTLLKDIKSVSDELKTLEGATGRFQRNVGNYANAFSQAFEPLQNQLEKIRTELNSGNFSGEALTTLQRQEQALLQVTEQLSQEFSSTSQQSRAFQEAVAQIGLQFGENSKVFQQFRDQVGEGVDSLNDIRDSIKLAASDTGRLDKLISAAQGIAGGFAVAQGAAALFGDDSEELQKTLVKLNAVMTILNGLQSIQNELRNKDSLLRKAINFLTAQETKLIQSKTVVQKADTIATNTATTATNKFGTALKALTIGTILIILPLLVSALSSVSKSTELVNKHFGETNEKSKAVNESLKQLGETASAIAKGVIDELTNDINSLNDELGKTPSSVDKALGALDLLKKEAEKIKKDKEFFHFDLSLEGIGNSFHDIGAAFGLAEGRLTANAEEQEKIRTKLFQLYALKRTKALEDDLTKQTNAYQENTKIQAQLVIDSNNRILSNDKSTQSQKISALQSNLQQQRLIIQQELNKDLATAGKDQTSRQLAQSKANADLTKAQRDFNEQLLKLNEDFAKKRKQINLDNQKALSDQISSIARAQADNEKNSYDVRLTFLSAFYEQQKKILKTELDAQLADKNLSSTEKETVELKYQTNLLSLQRQFSGEAVKLSQDQINKELAAAEKSKQKQLQIEKDIAQAKKDLKNDELQSIENGSSFVDTSYAKQYAEAEKALLDSYNNRKIDQVTYEQRSLQLQIDFQKKQLENDINAAKRSLQVGNLTEDEKLAFKKKIADLELQIAKLTGQQIAAQEQSNVEKLKSAIQAYGTIASNLGDIINNIGSISISRDNDALEKQLSLLEDKKNKEIEIVNQTIYNEDAKAKAIAEINARAEARENAINARKRILQERQARYEKAANVANIATTTALAVVTTLADKTIQPGYLRIPLAVTVGVLGLAQLAKAIATPIPQYKFGTEDHDGGLAIVGDGGKKELAIMPDGKTTITPDKPTLVNLPKHTRVIPDADRFMKMHYSMTMPKAPAFESTKMDAFAYMNTMTTELKGELKQVKEVIKNKRELHAHLTPFGWMMQMKDSNNQIDYLNDNLHF